MNWLKLENLDGNAGAAYYKYTNRKTKLLKSGTSTARY